jgi:hypothetical protein
MREPGADQSRHLVPTLAFGWIEVRPRDGVVIVSWNGVGAAIEGRSTACGTVLAEALQC